MTGPDLDKLRDEKCIPVARMVLNDMAVEGIPMESKTRAAFQPIVMKILQRGLDADLNLTTENPYIFQLLIGIFAPLNATIAECVMAPTDDTRYANIVKKMLSIVATANVPMGLDPASPEIRDAFQGPVKEQLAALIAEEKLTWLETKYILETLLVSLQAVQQIFSQNIEDATERMEAKILGIDSMSDLTMKRLNEALVTPTDTATAA